MRSNLLEKPARVDDALREVDKIKSIVTDAVEDSVRSASQALKHGRYAAEDVIEEARHTVKQRPFQTIAMAFAAGMLAGSFLAWIGLRRR